MQFIHGSTLQKTWTHFSDEETEASGSKDLIAQVFAVEIP